jgi:hypothetical protein
MMPTPEETAFMADPKSFMEDNMLRVDCGQKMAGQYAFSLVANTNVPSRRKNRRGRAIQYFELTEDTSGAVQMWFLPYQYADVRECTLPTNGADLMVTVQLNGCSFGWAQSSANAGCYVTHHNAARDDNDKDVIEAQTINNPYTDPFAYFHQTGYRKLRRGQVDTRYFATVVGKRDGGNHWRFYAQKKKNVFTQFTDDKELWTLKGVVVINP